MARLMTPWQKVTEAEVAARQSPRAPEVKKEPKRVKDGVDILGLTADKAVDDCESSLELILVTLSKSCLIVPN